MFRTVGDLSGLWEALLPPELLVLPAELARVDETAGLPGVFRPVRGVLRSPVGSTVDADGDLPAADVSEVPLPAVYESLCREVSDSIIWRRFCRVPLDGQVPHPTTLMKLTTRCGSVAVDGLNEALLAKAAEAK